MMSNATALLETQEGYMNVEADLMCRERRIMEMDGSTRSGPFDRGPCTSLLEVRLSHTSRVTMGPIADVYTGY